MGIVTDPGYEMWGVDFLGCFLVGHTPKKLYLSVSGLIYNTATPPGSPPPPNGIWLLEQKLGSPAIWEYAGSVWNFMLMLDTSASVLEIEKPGAFAFAAYFQGACALYYENMGQPESIYAEGIAVVSPRPDFGPRPTIKGVMDLMNIEPAAKTFAEIFPKSGGYMVYKFNLKSDKTNVKFLIDPAEY